MELNDGSLFVKEVVLMRLLGGSSSWYVHVVQGIELKLQLWSNLEAAQKRNICSKTRLPNFVNM